MSVKGVVKKAERLRKRALKLIAKHGDIVLTECPHEVTRFGQCIFCKKQIEPAPKFKRIIATKFKRG